MSDRVIPLTSTIESEQWLGEFIIEPTGQVYVTELNSYPRSRYVRERTPTGGRIDPKVEKPFTNGTLMVNFPSGSLRRVMTPGQFSWRSTGSHATRFAMRDSGKNLSGFLEFPMGGSRFPSADSQSIYPPSVNADLLSQAEVKALNKLREKGVEDSLNFGLVWAERKETAALFTQGATAMLRLAQSIKRRDASAAIDVLLNDFRATFGGSHPERLKRKIIRDTKRAVRSSGSVLDTMSSCVLAWNLGVSPLLRDIDAAVTLLQTGLLTKDWNIKSVSKYSRTINDRDLNDWPSTGVKATTTVSEVHGYTVTLIGRPDSTTSALLGVLGLNNPLSLAYQATSLTFIVDYFYALGPWLDSLMVAGEFTFTGGSWTQKVSRIVTLEIVSSAGVMKGDYVLNYVSRKLYSEFPMPLPPLSLRERQLTDKQMLNTGLIAIQKLKDLLK